MATKKKSPKKKTAKARKSVKKPATKKKSPAKKKSATKKKAPAKKKLTKKKASRPVKKPVKKSRPVKKKVAKKATPKKVKKVVKKSTVSKKKVAPKSKTVKKNPSKVVIPPPVVNKPGGNTNPTNNAQTKKGNNPLAPDYIMNGQNTKAPFLLRVYRGEGMALLAMNWRTGNPPADFAGFGLEYKAPGGKDFAPIQNMIRFLKDDGSTDPAVKSSLVSPIQQFRWIHFPPNDEALTNPGIYNYRVTALFMDANGKINPINSGDVQEATANLCNETYPGELNVAFTRGFIASQAFINNFGDNKDISTLLAGKADDGLKFVAKDPAKQAAAFEWMGYKSRRAILDLLDNAVKDVTAQVRVAAFDLNEPEVVSRLVKLGGRLKVIIDDSKSHNGKDTAETQAATMLTASAGAANVIRGHLGSLQHNKIIAVSGSVQMAVCGSTNFSLRGFLVQSNNAIIVHGAGPVKLFFDDFDNMFINPNNPSGFGSTASAQFVDLQLPSVKAQIAFSPHSSSNAMLQTVADDLNKTSSNLFYSLAFLNITPGPIKEGIKSLVKDPNKYVTGLADSNVSGLDIQLPGGSKPISFPAALLAKNVPPPFKTEVTGGHGVRLHHKFLVIDFDQPDKARVWMGSYNFSNSADRKNGENLVLLQDQRVAVSYMIEAVSMFDHYRFRDATENPPKKISLKTPPKAGESAWWAPFFDVKDPKNRDMKLFCPMV